mmetsp:Transcript_21190/g.58394  ORF Transcript_21190/g.58394 Transcript_21190/m.58394 type:complete len:235 (-) Transcript_21190:100-804(-)
MRTRCVLTEQQVKDIYMLKATHGHKNRHAASVVLGKEYQVSSKTIRDIWNGRRWFKTTEDLWGEDDLADMACREEERKKRVNSRSTQAHPVGVQPMTSMTQSFWEESLHASNRELDTPVEAIRATPASLDHFHNQRSLIPFSSGHLGNLEVNPNICTSHQITPNRQACNFTGQQNFVNIAPVRGPMQPILETLDAPLTMQCSVANSSPLNTLLAIALVTAIHQQNQPFVGIPWW